jgi:adenosylcobinamide-GDP ribazoletransferase
MLARRGDRRPDHTGRAATDATPGAAGSALAGLALALQFLTVLPIPRLSQAVPAEEVESAPNMAAALPWFPLVGAFLGGVLALIDWALRPALSLGVRSVMLLVVAAGITGMLHLDGFIDCCDGLLGARSTERRLAILRDSRVGAYGVVGGSLLILLRYVALAALSQPDMRLFALVAAALLGRWGMVYAVVRFPYARSSGAGTPFRATGRRLTWASVLAGALVITISILSGAPSLAQALVRAALVAGIAVLVTAGVTMWMSRRLDGGLTGDTYGALNECVEVAVLVLVPLTFAAGAHLPVGPPL